MSQTFSITLWTNAFFYVLLAKLAYCTDKNEHLLGVLCISVGRGNILTTRDGPTLPGHFVYIRKLVHPFSYLLEQD